MLSLQKVTNADDRIDANARKTEYAIVHEAARSGSMEGGIAVIGLGYVGLPVALAMSDRHPGVPAYGYDLSAMRVQELGRGIDRTSEMSQERLLRTGLKLVNDPALLEGCTFFIVAVPTPLDEHHRPDLQPLISACRSIGPVLGRGAVVVFESTVYPGVTREICGPVLAETSGLRQGIDFKLGYSPERIVPGDPTRRLEDLVKIVAGEDSEALERVAAVYEKVVDAGLHWAPSIEVAEAAKVIENIQRDVNIALINELALILDRLDLSTRDVLAAAKTKWNFLPFTPGLVGGHCIGVDPYYLSTKAESVGHYPELILAARRINDSMGVFIARRLIRMLTARGERVRDMRVAILGLSFKENVPDLRNSRIPDILKELAAFGIDASVCDPLADSYEALNEYGVSLAEFNLLSDLDALILAVPHAYFFERYAELLAMLAPGGILLDVKSVIDPRTLPADIIYWSP